MRYIIIPGTSKRLAEGSIITIPRLPEQVWIVKNGWYSYEDQRLNGWYFLSMPGSEILPINDEDLRELVIVSSPCPSPAPPSPWPCPPTPPCPPPIPESAKPIERYFSGTYYFEDQLLYLEEGDLYQTTKKFRASWEFDSVSDNFQHDIELGNLITIVDVSDITDSISELQSDVRESNAEINTLKSAVEVIYTTIDGMKAYKYMLNFWEVFGHHFPTLSDANTFLSTLDPPVNPSLYISFINIDTDSDTYGHIFTYYPDPSDSSSLILVDIIIHNHDDRYYQKADVDELLNGRLKIYTQESEIPLPTAELEGQLFTWGRATSWIVPDLHLEVDPGYVYVCSRDPDNAGVYYWRNVPKEITSHLLSLKENISNKVTSLIEESTDEQYPSAKAVYAKISSLTGEDIAYDNEYTLNGFIDALISDIVTALSYRESISNKVTSLGYDSTNKEYPSAKAVYSEIARVDAAVAETNDTLDGKEDAANKVTTIDGDSTDEQYLSAKCVYSELEEVDSAISGISDTLSGKEDAANKVIAMSAASTDEQYPSAKAVYAKISSLTGEDIAWDDDRTLYDMLSATFSGFDDALSAKQMKTLYFSDITVSDWDADETYADYSYRASVALTDVEETMLPDMVYGVAEATSGNYAPVCAAYSGGVYIYSKVDDEITIPSIKCEVTSAVSSIDEDYAPEIPLDEWSDWGVNTYKLNSVGSTEDYTYYQISYKEYPFAVGDTITLYGLRSEEDADYVSRQVVEGTFEDDQTVSSSGIKVLEFLADETVYFKIYTGYHYDNGSVVLDSVGEHNIVLEVDHSYIRYDGFLAFDYPREVYPIDTLVTLSTIGLRYKYENNQYEPVNLPGEYIQGTTYYTKATTKTWQFNSKDGKYGQFVLDVFISEDLQENLYKLVLSLPEYPENYSYDISSMSATIDGIETLSACYNYTYESGFMTYLNFKSYQQFIGSQDTLQLIGFDGMLFSDTPEFTDNVYKDGLLVRYPVVLYYMTPYGSTIDPTDIDIKIDFKPYYIGDISLDYNTNSNMTFDTIGYYAPNLQDIVIFDDFKFNVFSVYDNKKKQDSLSIINDNEYGLCAKTDKYVIQFNKSIQNGSLISDNTSLVARIFDSDINYLTFDFTSIYNSFVFDKKLKYQSIKLYFVYNMSFEGNISTYESSGSNIGDITSGHNIPYQNYLNGNSYVSYLDYGYDDPSFVKLFTFSNGIAFINSPHTEEKLVEIRVNKSIDENGVIYDTPNSTLYLRYKTSESSQILESIYIDSTSTYEIDSRIGYLFSTNNFDIFSESCNTKYSETDLINIRESIDSEFSIQDLIGRTVSVYCMYTDYTTGTQNLTFAQSSTITDGEGNYAIEAVGDGIKIVYMGGLQSSQTGHIYYVEREVDTDYSDNPIAYTYPGVVAIDIQTEYDGKILSHIAFNTTDYGVTNYFD